MNVAFGEGAKLMRLIVPMIMCVLIAGCAGSESTSVDNPKNAEYHFQRAMEHHSRAEHDLAIKELDEVIRLDPRNAIGYSARGAVWFVSKKYDQAITDLNEAIRLEPDNPSSGYYIRGAAWYMKKEYAKGVKDFDKALELNANELEALNSRAWAAATCPDPNFRDRTSATTLKQPSMRRSFCPI
jgi:tetratricopeptide (TPR) repeat protein